MNLETCQALTKENAALLAHLRQPATQEAIRRALHDAERYGDEILGGLRKHDAAALRGLLVGEP